MTALTRNDVNRIISKFDQTYFPDAKKPSSKQEALKQCLEVNQFVQVLEIQENFPAEVVDNIVRKKLKSSPSIGALFLYYLGSPALSRFSTSIALNPLCLEKASRLLLKKLRKEPTKERVELACFKQLMTFVFEEHFKSLILSQQLEMAQKIQGTTWEIQNSDMPPGNDLLVKINQLQKKLLVDQAGWNRIKIELQVTSWKVQLIIGRVLSTYVVKIGLMLGSAYCAVRTYFLLRSMGHKIADAMGRYFTEFSEYGFRALGEDPHGKGNFPLKVFVILITVMLGSVIGVAYLAARIHIFCRDRLPPLLLDILELPFVVVSDLVTNPAGLALKVGFGIYNAGEALTGRVARSMDEAVIASQKEYIQNKIPTLKERWHQIILHPPLPVIV